jgi:hypothetical protein
MLRLADERIVMDSVESLDDLALRISELSSKFEFLAHVVAHDAGAEGKWDVKRLDPVQQECLGKAVSRFFRERDARGLKDRFPDEKMYAVALEVYGFNCPHPFKMRKYYPRTDDFKCEACGMIVCRIRD